MISIYPRSEALDVTAPYCPPEWRITGFCEDLKAVEELGAVTKASSKPAVCCSGIFSKCEN